MSGIYFNANDRSKFLASYVSVRDFRQAVLRGYNEIHSASPIDDEDTGSRLLLIADLIGQIWLMVKDCFNGKSGAQALGLFEKLGSLLGRYQAIRQSDENSDSRADLANEIIAVIEKLQSLATGVGGCGLDTFFNINPEEGRGSITLPFDDCRFATYIRHHFEFSRTDSALDQCADDPDLDDGLQQIEPSRCSSSPSLVSVSPPSSTATTPVLRSRIIAG